MTNNQTKMGFTLIELLVVVLIIGILASVALPQYNKAVRKARLSEVTTTFNAISKAIDMYVMENGQPASSTVFSGPNKTVELDISIPCTVEDGNYCYTKVGRLYYFCNSSSCNIDLETTYNTDKTSGNKWLNGAPIQFRRGTYNNGQWGLYADNLTASNQYPVRDVCRWWTNTYGTGREVNMSASAAATVCNSRL